MRHCHFLVSHVLACFLGVLLFQTSLFGQISEAPVEELVKQLGEENVDRRRDAAYELVRRQLDSEDVILAFAKAVSDGDDQVRFQALLGLARAADSATPAIPQLIECLDSRVDQVRYRAADALGKIGTPSIEPLVQAWADASENERIAIAQAIRLIGEPASSTSEMLRQTLEQATGVLAGELAATLVAISPNDQGLRLMLCQHAAAEARQVGISSLVSITNPSEEVIVTLETAMQDSEDKIRETAVIALAKANVEAERKSDLLERGLVDASEAVRAAAIVGLRKADLDRQAFAQRIAELLPEADPVATNSLLKAIALFPVEAKQTLPIIVDATQRHLESQSADFDQEQAVETLAGFGEGAVGELLQTIEQRPVLEPLLARALAAIGKPAVPSLIAGMKDQKEWIRLASVRAIGSLRELDEPLIDQLVMAVSDSSTGVRQLAVELLIERGSQSQLLRESLLAANKDADAKVRSTALRVVGKFDLKGDEAKEIIKPALQDPAPEVKASALEQLLASPKMMSEFRSTLLDLAGSRDASVREGIAKAFGRLDAGQVDQPIIDALIRLLGDEAAMVCIAAIDSAKVLKLENEAVFKAYGECLSRQPEIVLAALDAIQAYGEKGAALIEPVTLVLEHEQPSVRVAAVNALSDIDKDAERLTNLLLEVLDDAEWEVRRAAGVRLGKIGPNAKAATIKLFTLLSVEEDSDFASEALKEINAAPVEAVDLLMQHLESEDRRARFYAITLLGKIGPEAKPALPKLEAMLEQRNSEARERRSDFVSKLLQDSIDSIKGSN